MSFNGNKMITTSGGGALICPDEAAKKKTMFYATQSREPMPYYLHKEIGYNYRMSNICAGIGRGQMTILDEHLAHHKHLCDRYVELLGDVDGITVHTNPDDRCDSNYWLNTIIIDLRRRELTMRQCVCIWMHAILSLARCGSRCTLNPYSVAHPPMLTV